MNLSECKVTIRIFQFQIDFWTYPTESLNPVEIHVEPTAVQKLEDLLNGKGISFEVSQEDVQKAINQEQATSRAGGFDSKYHSLREVRFISQTIKMYERIYCDFIVYIVGSLAYEFAHRPLRKIP